MSSSMWSASAMPDAPIRDGAPVWIVGAGAVGLTLAARLAATSPVTVVARGARVEALQQNGITLSGAIEQHVRVGVVALESQPRPPAGAVVISAVKAHDLRAAHSGAGVAVSPEHVLVLAQNGIGIADFAAGLTPGVPIVRMTCWFGAALAGRARGANPTSTGVSAGAVHLAGFYQLELGASDAAALRRVHMPLTLAGLPVAVAPSVAACEWRKSLWNLAISGPCALLDLPNGAILDDPALRRLAEGLLAEARAVAAADGVTLTDDDVARVFASTEKTRANRNAMVYDLRSTSPGQDADPGIVQPRLTEMRWLNAEVARRAAVHGLAAPQNQAIADLVMAAERLRGE